MNNFFVFILAMMLCVTFYSVSPGEVNPNYLPAQVHEFVVGMIGNFEGGYFVANQELTNERTTIVDITIIIQGESARFVLILENGIIQDVQNIALDAEVDCQEEYTGFIDGA